MPFDVWGDLPEPGSVSAYRDPKGYVLRFHGVADFEVGADGAEVRCFPAQGPHGALWKLAYEQHVRLLQLAQQGRAVFHGGSVCQAGAAAVFLGPSGQGKSTLTAACAARGMAFLTDDCLLVQESPEPCIEPDSNYIRLWGDSYAALGGTEPIDMRDPWLKPRLYANADTLPQAAAPVPLACMIALGVAQGDAVVLQALSPTDAALIWTGNAFFIDQGDPRMMGRVLACSARLAEAVPAYRLSYPRDYARLPEVVDAVSACLGEAAAARRA